MMSEFGFLMMGGGIILQLALWVLVIVGGVWLALRLARRSQPIAPAGTVTDALQSTQVSQNPVEILKLRYANGEITREQFEELKSDLSV
jgi:uncharacterized membrane protein